MLKIILLQETTSTNDVVKRNVSSMESGTMIVAYKQTAGRGQKGNSWEAEPGKNITFSLLIKKPNLNVKEQFYMSEAVSLAIVDALEKYATGFKIKWPNDIYYDDRKIGGILIEHSLDNNWIAHTIIGVGVNINQQVFTSGAPNPVSLTRITGEFYDMNALTEEFGALLERYCRFDGSRTQLEALHKRYLEKLYRYDGKPHPFVLPSGAQLNATIEAVASDGILTLRHESDNSLHNYYFKEVGFVINKTKFL